MNINPSQIDVEYELSAAIRAIGGARVDAEVGKKPGFKNADFIFNKYSIVAELKILSKDYISDPKFVDKISHLYNKALSSNDAPRIIFGTVRDTTDGYPDWYREEIANLYAIPIRRVVSAACKQIKQTRINLNIRNYKGVLLLVNDGNTALDPSHICWSLSKIFSHSDFSEISQVIYFTVNMPQHIESCLVHNVENKTFNCWVPLKINSINPEFEPAIRSAWFQHLSGVVGKVTEIDAGNLPISSLRNATYYAKTQGA